MKNLQRDFNKLAYSESLPRKLKKKLYKEYPKRIREFALSSIRSFDKGLLTVKLKISNETL